MTSCDSLFASRQLSVNKFRERCEAVKIFASRCGGNLIEFDIAVRHAVRHLDSMHVRAGSRNRIIRSHKSRVCQCVPMHDACTRVCMCCVLRSFIVMCSKTSSVPRRNGLYGTVPAWQIYDDTRSWICVFYAELMTTWIFAEVKY